MLRKIILSMFALTMLIGASTVNTQPAEARRGVGLGIAAGIVAGTALGAYAYGAPRHYRSYDYVDGPECYAGPRQCAWHGRSCWHNRWGEYVCSRGEYRCWRPTICD
jgi:hypothetical protein